MEPTPPEILITPEELIESEADNYIKQLVFIQKIRNNITPENAANINSMLNIYEVRKQRTERGLSLLAKRNNAGSAQDIVVNRLNEVIDAMNSSGYHQNGMKLVGITSNDLSILEDLSNQIKSDEYIMEPAVDEDEEYVERLRREYGERKQTQLAGQQEKQKGIGTRPKQFEVDTNLYNSGERVTIEFDEFEETRDVNVILYPGRKITVSVTGWDVESIPTVQDRSEDAFTYYQANGVFYYDKPFDKRKVTRTITCLDDEDIKSSFGSLHSNIRSKDSIKVEERLGKETKKRVRDILHKNIDYDALGIEEIPGIPQAFLLSRAPIKNLLREMMDVVDKLGNGEVIGTEENIIEEILEQIEKRGEYYGACQSQSVLMAAFCEAVGLPARIMAGEVIDADTGEPCGHQWTEVYIPAIKKYVPVDSAIGTFLTYPSEGYLYSLNGFVSAKEGKPIQLRVDYQDKPSEE